MPQAFYHANTETSITHNGERIINDLVTHGYTIIPNCFSPLLMEALRQELIALDNQDNLTVATVGREQDNQLNKAIRRDKIHWLEGTTPAQTQFFAEFELLRQTVNRELFMGLFAYEAHFAYYPEGAFYKKHFDSFKGEKNRLLSVVTYLNHNWQPEDGGQLRLYHTENHNEILCDVQPQLGTCVIFLSEDVPHEVLVSHRPRMSIAGWFHCRNENPIKAADIDILT